MDDTVGNVVFWFFVVGVLAIVVIWILSAILNSSHDATQKRRMREKYSGPLQPFVQFLGQSGTGLHKVVERARVNADEEDLSAKRLLMFDSLIVLIKKIAIPNGQLRLSDAEMLRVYCWDSDEWQFSSTETYALLGMIRDFEEEKFLALQGMQLLKAPGTQELANIYLKLAKTIADTPARKTALKTVQGEVKEVINPTPKPKVEEVYQNIGHIFKAILDDHQKEIDRVIKKEKDPRYGILGVHTPCTITEIEETYHLKVKILSPETMSVLAPELREHAEQLIAVVNGAYESLCAEYGETD